MDWPNERFVRLYVRDTESWRSLPWQARALFPLLLRKLDRSGILETKLGARGVAIAVDLPARMVEKGLTALLADGCVTACDRGYVVPNFLEAQDAPQSDRQRQRESRARRRDKAMGLPVTIRDEMSRDAVTESHSEPAVQAEPAVPRRDKQRTNGASHYATPGEVRKSYA